MMALRISAAIAFLGAGCFAGPVETLRNRRMGDMGADGSGDGMCSATTMFTTESAAIECSKTACTASGAHKMGDMWMPCAKHTNMDMDATNCKATQMFSTELKATKCSETLCASGNTGAHKMGDMWMPCKAMMNGGMNNMNGDGDGGVMSGGDMDTTTSTSTGLPGNESGGTSPVVAMVAFIAGTVGALIA